MAKKHKRDRFSNNEPDSSEFGTVFTVVAILAFIIAMAVVGKM